MQAENKSSGLKTVNDQKNPRGPLDFYNKTDKVSKDWKIQEQMEKTTKEILSKMLISLLIGNHIN